jgi:HSP20 family protein
MADRREKAVGFRLDPFGELDPFGWRPFGFGRGLGAPWRLFDELAGEGPRPRPLVPSVDIAEDDDAYHVTAELPGTKPEDVTVEVHEGVLTLRGEKRSEREGRREHARYVERSYGTFSRSFRLPENANVEKLDASFKDGVLHVTIAKREEAKPRTVSIKS